MRIQALCLGNALINKHPVKIFQLYKIAKIEVKILALLKFIASGMNPQMQKKETKKRIKRKEESANMMGLSMNGL